MGVVVRWMTIDTTAPQRLAPFWEQLLGWHRVPDMDLEHEVGLVAEEGTGGPIPGGVPGLLLFRSSAPTPGKNRVHLDLVPAQGGEAERDAEVERACALGARRVDVGQEGGEPWVVLADPEGNEFCILTPPEG